MKINRTPVLLLLFLIPFSLFSLSINMRSFDHNGYTRVVLEGDRAFAYNVEKAQKNIKVKLNEPANVPAAVTSFRKSKLVRQVVHRVENGKSVLDVQLKSSFKVKRNFVLERPYRVVFDLVREQENPKTTPKASEYKASQLPSANEEQKGESNEGQTETAPQEDPQSQEAETQEEDLPVPVVPASPVKKWARIETICIDAGHGGTDRGAIGPLKTEEKDITLKVGKQLKHLLASRLGLRVLMTRDDDTEVSLNSRVSMANNAKAQLFVSIHVNASHRRSARGPETFYVSLEATDQEALKLSQKENNSFKEVDEMTKDDGLKMILWDMAQNEYIKESSKLAEYIQYELNILMHTRNRGVKQAPFRVLMRAAMPSVLVEIAFLSNVTEEKKLQDNAFLRKAAEAIYTGISKYIYYHNSLYR